LTESTNRKILASGRRRKEAAVEQIPADRTVEAVRGFNRFYTRKTVNSARV